MNEYRPPWIVAFLISSLKSSLILIWGGALLWYGLSLGDMPLSDGEPVGHYSFHIMGAIFIVLGLCGFAYNIIKLRAPTKAEDKLTEAVDVTFDADAAMARYLASREQPEASHPPVPSSAATRPVFGRKSADPL